MLFLIFGSSGSGKTAALEELRTREIDGLAIHDFDEIGVPPGADRRWRHEANEIWLRRALRYQAHGIDLVVAGQTPIGELLATPSAPQVDCISTCLLDCDDETRVERLRERRRQFPGRSSAPLGDYVNWATWLRAHAEDPQWSVEVIRQEDGPRMHWDRWEDWEAGDPRWRVRVIDTSHGDVAKVADALAEWITNERALHRAGSHPLTDWATG